MPNDYDPSNWLTVSIGDLWQNVYSLALGDTYLIGDRYGEFVPRDSESILYQSNESEVRNADGVGSTERVHPVSGTFPHDRHVTASIGPSTFNRVITAATDSSSPKISAPPGRPPDRIWRQLYPFRT